MNALRDPLETRLSCPVCLGVTLEKARVTGRGTAVVLDVCPRCGGIWFELGEVGALRAHPPAALWSRLQQRETPFRGPCHDCGAIIDRNAERCEACRAENRIECPQCDRPLHAETHDGLRLDVCRECRGVWFDHAEIAALWKLNLAVRPRSDRLSTTEAAPSLLLDALVFSPDLLFLGAHAAGMAAEGGAAVLANAPGAVTGMAETAVDAASGIFETILEIIGGVFS